jgi:ankyrin repeat protein
VRRLLASGASVRATDAQGRTPLVAAAYSGAVEVAQLLLAAGADPNEKDETVQSAYLIATSEVGDDPTLLDLLLRNGADVTSRDSFNGTGLIRAADRGFPRIVERLLQTDIAVDHVNRLGWTALHEAIILGDGGDAYVRVVALLVDAGVDVNLASAQDGRRPLTHATDRGFVEIADVLRAAGAQP